MTNLLLAVASTILWGFWALFDKKLSLTNNIYWINAYFACSVMVLTPAYLYVALKYGGRFTWKWETVGWSFASIVSSTGAWLIFIWLLKRSDASWVTSFTAAYPLVTVALGWFLLKESITLSTALGAVFVVFGLIFLSR